jgi:predicted CXXCH cytochrome family protein
MRWVIPVLCVLAVASPDRARADLTIVNTKHNLSTSGPGPIKAVDETQICKFCHIPHQGAEKGGNNRPNSVSAYQPYSSPTLASAPPGVPTGATRICLSCHDGTIAIGQTVRSGMIGMVNAGPGGTIPEGPGNVGTDLRKTHPVSFHPGLSPEIRTPPPGDAVKLDASGAVQCTSCHDPHRDRIDPVRGKFLVKSNRASALCLSCHAMPSWSANHASHQSSPKFYDASLGATTPHTTVSDNGCESCHRTHAAATDVQLMKGVGASVCMQCHNGRVGDKNIGVELNKPYAHGPVAADPNIHSAAEGPASPSHPLPETRSTQQRHAECPDCHNPHASYAQSALAPNVPGSLFGVWGIDRNGNKVMPARYEYEICFKCHADSANKPSLPQPPETVRHVVFENNLRRQLDLTAPSAHAVEGPGRNPNVPGLLKPLTEASTIYCSDCHASDSGPGAGGPGPRGPHASSYRHILERNLITADNTVESPDAYALCYKCHDRQVLLSSTSGFKLHASHVATDRAPCTTCHTWHGVSSTQGNEINNAHLMDFDISIVAPAQSGVLQYTSTGSQHGTCTLTCHGVEHVNKAY